MVYKKILWEKFSQRIFLSVNGRMTVNEKFLLTFVVILIFNRSIDKADR
jgi:hypothetical protein